MNITIKRLELDTLKGKGIKEIDEFLRYNDWNSDAKLKVDLTTLSKDKFDMIRKVLSKDEKRNACPLDVMKQYEKVSADPLNARPRTLDQFATMLKAYMANFPKYWFFVQDGDEDNRWRAYVCSGIGYKPPRKTRDGVEPAYVWMRGSYYERGATSSETWYWYARDMEGKKVVEVIAKDRILPTSPDLAKYYEEDTAKYKSLRGAVGTQLWGAGRAETVGDSWHRRGSFSLDVDGRKARLVIDDHVEGSDRKKNEATEGAAPTLDGAFWKGMKRLADPDEDPDDEPNDADEASEIVLEVPLYPTVLVFNLEKHEQAWTHVRNLEAYEYDKSMGGKLVLPEFQKDLIEVLVEKDRAEFRDIVAGKAGGSIVLCSGTPGTGKTLTAEVFAERMERPLYVVASSQLGTNPSELEAELKLVLDRATRFNAIMLIDEADVFIHERGDDLIQNAVVGVFLRVLEYYQGVLFMTTNRVTIVDDAIMSRCTAQVKFEIPKPEAQAKIWRILADQSGIKLAEVEIRKIVKDHPGLSGRDVKGLLKLANMVAAKRKEPVTAKMVEFITQFKPTAETSAERREEATAR